MKTLVESAAMLDRGGKPTVRDLLAGLVFNPVDGTIRLNGERLVMQRAALGAELRRELLRLLGHDEARVFLIRLGFLSGRADARFIRTAWPGLDIGDAFTAGTRLHMFSGTVRVETVHNDFDFRKKRFAGEFLWHNSAEAAEVARQQPPVQPRVAEPACWTQVGYASGYATEFFDTLIVYKEVACAAEGHKACRVIGKPAEMWGGGDPEVAMFRERVLGTAAPARPPAPRIPDAPPGDLDRLVLAPVRAQLDRLAAMALPVLIVGAPGTGRWRAARHLHQAAGGSGEPRRIPASQLTPDLIAGLSAQGRGGRRGGRPDPLVIDDIEDTPAALQPSLAAALDDGAGAVRVVALSSWPLSRLRADPALRRELWLALSVAPVVLPTLAERPADRLPLAEALLPLLADRMGTRPVGLAPEAARLIADSPWPGNLPELRAVLAAALVAHPGADPIAAPEIAAQIARLSAPPAQATPVAPWLDAALANGGLSMDALERGIYEAAVARTGGNLSAAARLLGLTRPQLAYRMGAKDNQRA